MNYIYVILVLNCPDFLQLYHYSKIKKGNKANSDNNKTTS